MTGEAMKEVLEKVAYLATNAANWRRDCGAALQEADDARKERDEARREVEKLKAERNALQVELSDARDIIDAGKSAYNALEAHLAAERAKKSGPVEGTWAWACEYVEKNRNKFVVRGNSVIHMKMGDSGCVYNSREEQFRMSGNDILATDWRVVES